MATPKTGTVHTYNADPSMAPDPALAGLAPDTEVTVKAADRDRVTVTWTDASGAREADVKPDVFAGSFVKKS